MGGHGGGHKQHTPVHASESSSELKLTLGSGGSDGGGGSPIGGSHGGRDAKVFAVGSRIEAQFGGGDDWFAGRVRKVNRNGSFDIDYDDGDEERNVLAGCMRIEGNLPMFIEDGSDTGTTRAANENPGGGTKRALEVVVNGNGNGTRKVSSDIIINSGNRNRNRDRNRDRNRNRSNGGKLRVVGKAPVQAAPSTKVASEMSLESILALNARAPKKPRKGGIGGSGGSKGGGRAVAKEVKSTWVQCEEPACLKWRMIPASVNNADLPEVFRCSMNRWDPSQASCAVPEAGLKAGEAETAVKVKTERRKKKEVVLDPSTARCMTKAGQAWWQRTLAGL